jgi:hypothetical protein
MCGAGFLCVVAATGCDTDGSVTIRNQSGTQLTGTIDDRGFSLSGFESIEISIKVGTQFAGFGPTEKEVLLEAESCTRRPFSTMVTIERGDNTDVSVGADATCVLMENQSEYDVIEMHRRLAGTGDWGPNRIDDPLSVAENVTWRLDPDIYDFRMIDECEDTTVVLSDTLTAGTRRFVVHTGNNDGCLPGLR